MSVPKTRAATAGAAEKQNENDTGSSPGAEQELIEVLNAIQAATEETAREVKALRIAIEAKLRGMEEAIRLLLEARANDQGKSARPALRDSFACCKRRQMMWCIALRQPGYLMNWTKRRPAARNIRRDVPRQSQQISV
jgi:hypothetical protein